MPRKQLDVLDINTPVLVRRPHDQEPLRAEIASVRYHDPGVLYYQVVWWIGDETYACWVPWCDVTEVTDADAR